VSSTLQQYWFALQQTPVFEPGALLLLTLLLARYAALPLQYQPWPLLHVLAQRIATKVNKASDSQAQQRLAGSLALILLVVPLLVLAWALRHLSEWPAGFDALLLYLCLDHRHFSSQVTIVAGSLQRQQLQLAKDQLQPMLRRDCGQLSATGLAKAGVEVLAQRQLRHFAAVLFWFLVAGAVTALAWRLVVELQQAWSGKITNQRHFGSAVSRLGRLMLWPVCWLQGALVAMLFRFVQSVRYFRNSQQAGLPAAQRWYLSAWSAGLQRNLAGPVMIQGVKIRRERIGPDRAPDLADLILAQVMEQQIQRALWLLCCSGFALTLFYQWPPSL
jgi:adenosylcobinamide-phosphate synthase